MEAIAPCALPSGMQRPSTAEQDVYLQELVSRILHEREETMLNLSKVVYDVEERLKWEQAANEQR